MSFWGELVFVVFLACCPMLFIFGVGYAAYRLEMHDRKVPHGKRPGFWSSP